MSRLPAIPLFAAAVLLFLLADRWLNPRHEAPPHDDPACRCSAYRQPFDPGSAP